MPAISESRSARRILACALLLALGGLLAAPFLARPRMTAARLGTTAPPSERPRTAAAKLVIISPHSDTVQTEFRRGFSTWMEETRGYAVDIEWLDVGGTVQAIKYVEGQFQGAPDGIGVDVFFGGGSDPFMQFQRLGLLRACHLPQEVLAPIPRVHAGVEIYDKEQRWFGGCMSSFGLLYNKRVLALLKLPEPRTWADLGRPGYFTWVASSDPRLSGSMHMLYEIILQAYGWEEGWANLVRIGANCRSFGRSAGDVPNEVAVGEAACGMAIDYYGLRAVAEAGEENLAFCLPENLTVVNPDGIGVLKGAPQGELAELFVQFVLSERGQKLWMLKVGAPGGPTEFALYRLPVIAGLVEKYRHDSLVSIDAFELKGGVQFDLAKKDARWGALNDLLGACIIDVHQDLAAAWKRLKDLPPDSAPVRRLLRPPVGEQESLEIAERMREDPAFRADTVARWSAEARDKYRRLTKE